MESTGITQFRIGSTEIIETRQNDIVRYDFDGTRIYRIRTGGMAGVYTNAYLVLDTQATLIDLGYHFEKTRDDLLSGIKTLSLSFNEDITFGDIANIIITHAHIDHYGMLIHRELHGKRVYMHPSEERTIEVYTQKGDEWMHRVQELCNRTGGTIKVTRDGVRLSPELPQDMWQHYDRIHVYDGDEIINGYQVYHAPGHSAGHICIKIGPVLFVGDLIWSSAQPYMIPKGLNIVPKGLLPGLGLEDYLASLRIIADLGMPFGLAGHWSAIYPVADRAAETEGYHNLRLNEFVDLCRKDINLYQLANEYCKRHPEFIGASSLDGLTTLKKIVYLEDIGASVEYLLDHNRMTVSDNVDGVWMYRSNMASTP